MVTFFVSFVILYELFILLLKAPNSGKEVYIKQKSNTYLKYPYCGSILPSYVSINTIVWRQIFTYEVFDFRGFFNTSTSDAISGTVSAYSNLQEEEATAACGEFDMSDECNISQLSTSKYQDAWMKI